MGFDAQFIRRVADAVVAGNRYEAMDNAQLAQVVREHVMPEFSQLSFRAGILDEVIKRLEAN